MAFRETGHTIWRLPEFKALCDVLGIPWNLPTRHLIIDIPCYPEGVVTFTQTYLSAPKDGEPGVAEPAPTGIPEVRPEDTTELIVDTIDNTVVQNKRWTTHQPSYKVGQQ